MSAPPTDRKQPTAHEPRLDLEPPVELEHPREPSNAEPARAHHERQADDGDSEPEPLAPRRGRVSSNPPRPAPSRPPRSNSPPGRQGSSSRPSGSKGRPWYLVAAMCLMWLMGVVGMMSGCEEIDYLRGGREMPNKLAHDAEEAQHPLARTIVVRELAWVEALGRHHRRAFPIATMRMLVAIVLIVGAGGALVGRPSSRRLALQAIAASIALAGASFLILAPVRHAAAHAVAEEAVDNEVGVSQGARRDEVMAAQHAIAMRREQSMVLLEVALYGAAALALTRRRTRDYFAALAESVADAES